MLSPCLRATLAAACLAASVGSGADVFAQTPVSAHVGAAGRYAPLRDAGKDTGCMITLEAAGRAQLAPACRDQGLVIFDPVNWRLEQGRLALTARKGHKAIFTKQADGTWLRDPKEGKPLALRPI